MNPSRVFFVTWKPDLLSLHTTPLLVWSMLSLICQEHEQLSQGIATAGSEGDGMPPASVTYNEGADGDQVHMHLVSYKTAMLQHRKGSANIATPSQG